jgi:integrase
MSKTINLVDGKAIAQQPGAKEFLDDIARNSENTAKVYGCGLAHFQRFLGGSHSLQSIIQPLLNKDMNVYDLLNNFVGYLLKVRNGNDDSMSIARRSIANYTASARSYLSSNDVEIDSGKFKRKVKIPKIFKQSEEAIDAEDIRSVLLACNNRRLKPYLLVLASGAFRAGEAAGLRICDLDFSVTPTMVHVGAENAKTKTERDVYISDEATKYLQEWLTWKYRKDRYSAPIKKPNDLVFAAYVDGDVDALYNKMRQEFNKLLTVVKLDTKKVGMQRRKITLHSFRRFVDTTISDSAGKDYAEWFLGHANNSYYTKKESARREKYATECMDKLTFLNYTQFENAGKDVKDLQSQNAQLKKELEQLKQNPEVTLLKQQMSEMQQTLKDMYQQGLLKKG